MRSKNLISLKLRFIYRQDSGCRWLRSGAKIVANGGDTGRTLGGGTYGDINDEKAQRLKIANLEPRFELALQRVRHGLWKWDIQAEELHTNAREVIDEIQASVTKMD
ncbi:MAG: hypothetical protein ACU84Q_17715 [Gammaproteobacteria bacterium]